MTMVSHNDVGPCIDECTGVTPLPRCGCCDMFNAPMWTDDDVGRGVGFPQATDALAEGVDALLRHTE